MNNTDKLYSCKSFDPCNYLINLSSDPQQPQPYLPVSARNAWAVHYFHENARHFSMENTCKLLNESGPCPVWYAEAKIFVDDKCISVESATEAFYDMTGSYASRVQEFASTRARGRALANIGFSTISALSLLPNLGDIQLQQLQSASAEMVEEAANICDSGVSVTGGSFMTGPVTPPAEVNHQDYASAPLSSGAAPVDPVPPSAPMPLYSAPAMHPVIQEETNMTLEEAYGVVVEVGTYKGWTIERLNREEFKQIDWIVNGSMDGYKRKYPRVTAAARKVYAEKYGSAPALAE